MGEKIMENKNYKESGVDTDAADTWVNWIASENSQKIKAGVKFEGKVVSGIGDYAAIFAPPKSKEWIATTCDGVGTKTLWYSEGLGNPEAMAQDLVAMNVNDLLCVGATPRLFLDYLAIGNKQLLQPTHLMGRFLKGLKIACGQNGMFLVGGETAQMPDLYPGNHFDLAGFAVGWLKPKEQLSINRVKPGDELWGWPSSGPHSNGFSWLRKLFSEQTDREIIEKHFMKPTEIYTQRFLAARKNLSGKDTLRAAFHITGSGFLNLVRAEPKGGKRKLGFDLNPEIESQLPHWASLIKDRSGASFKDLATSFNLGWGFILVLKKGTGATQIKQLKKLGLTQLGKVRSGTGISIGGSSLE